MQIISEFVTAGLTAIVTVGGGWYLSTINKGLKIVKTDVKSLRETVDFDNQQLKKILEKADIEQEIDEMVRDSLYYIKDEKVMALINLQGYSAKAFFSYVVGIGFEDVSCQEIRGNFESLSKKLRDQLDEVGNDCMKANLNEYLKPVVGVFIAKVIEIKNDNLYNSRVDRFKRTLLEFVQDILSQIIRESIKVGL